MNAPLLEISGLNVRFGGNHVVKDVALTLDAGQTLAIVGESGSGKSVSALASVGLLPDSAAVTGSIKFRGQQMVGASAATLRKIRGKEIAYVFQEPSTSLNPVLTIRTQMAEALQLHRPDVKDLDAEIVKWLYQVGIVEPEKRLRAYPHELSGGMQQRVMIAMALCCQPRLLIADEPTTALDVTIQKQIIDLLAELKASLNMSVILITHNFAIIRGIADKVAVMFRGQIVESGTTEEVLGNPQHPYTKALLECVPRLGVKQARLKAIDYAAVEAAL